MKLNGFETATPCKQRAGISALNFNDLRGTAATKFYGAGIDQRIITEIPAWEDHFARIIRRYVGRAAATRELIAAINRAEKRA